MTCLCKWSRLPEKNISVPKWFLGCLCQPSKFPFLEGCVLKKEILLQNDFWITYTGHQNFLFWKLSWELPSKKGNPIAKWFLGHLSQPSNFPFLEIFVGTTFLKRKYHSKMNFKSHMLPSKISFFGMWVPSNLMAYVINNFLKRQFCFSRQKKFSSFLTLLHNPSNFLF